MAVLTMQEVIRHDFLFFISLMYANHNALAFDIISTAKDMERFNMEFRDALKSFRCEVGIAQTDVATALHINISTVARWEQGKTVPNRSTALLLLDYAKRKSSTRECIENLENALRKKTKQKLFGNKNSLYTVEHATISQLIEDASFSIYVCDLETDEILYANRATKHKLEKTLDELIGKKCYECIMHRDKPCEFCHKNQLVEESFSGCEAFRHFDGNYYRIFGKLVKWNGRIAQVRYFFELGGSVKIASKNELRLSYEKQLAMRRQYASDALAIAHYNLTDGTVSQVEYRNEVIANRTDMGRYEDIMRVLSENVYSPDEKKKFDSIRNCDSLIKLYFQGKTHISIKHRIKGFPGYFEDTFDLFQNPLTYDIEAFATLCDITDESVSDAIIGIILRGGFESIMTIDAATGEAHPYRGKHIREVIEEQRKLGDYIAGVKAYLRHCCVDEDIERVINETSLPYVKEQLKTKPVLTVAYSIRENGQVVYMQVQYSYLDEEQTTILCVLQDISESYNQLEAQVSTVHLPNQKITDVASVSNKGEQ